jgi:hypothetical protein
MPEHENDKSFIIWYFLANKASTEGISSSSTGAEISSDTDAGPSEVNSAIKFLVDSNLATWQRSTAAEPYVFSEVQVTPRGLYEIKKVEPSISQDTRVKRKEVPAPSPVGSPYGFTPDDFATISEKKDDSESLYVVLGHQFESEHYKANDLQSNVEFMFSDAVNSYNKKPDAPKTNLVFTSLAAGYGEHQFNEIARDIISADIAVFDTSDLNPNVMIEMGVALTWGIMVLPIRNLGCPKPPSDISGQTWAEYEDSAKAFVDPNHQSKLENLVERAVRKKTESLK